MIIVNLWFIKHSNGLFHYGLDYAAALGDSVREIWVRDQALALAVQHRLPGHAVRVLGRAALIGSMVRARVLQDVLFTASSHPFALSARSVVVLHDSFPFIGRVGRVKRWLFLAGLRLTRATAAYINTSDAAHFLHQHGVPDGRTVYLPNRIGAMKPARRDGNVRAGPSLTIALFGTDSPKKNYDSLFAAATPWTGHVPVTWRIFGHRNSYTDHLLAAHPACRIDIVGSDGQSMEAFLSTADVAVSIARSEGFARPVALALMSGIPTYLLDTPVFREFYDGSARFFATVPDLVAAVAAIRHGDVQDRPVLQTEQALLADFDRGVSWLQAR